MADLDDFFAKKDRKKSKSKKFATTDELAKKLDDTKQKSDVRPKKERPAQEGDEPGRPAVSFVQIKLPVSPTILTKFETVITRADFGYKVIFGLINGVT